MPVYTPKSINTIQMEKSRHIAGAIENRLTSLYSASLEIKRGNKTELTVSWLPYEDSPSGRLNTIHYSRPVDKPKDTN